jgi:hypothetical protein
MRIRDILFFAPNHKFADLSFENPTNLIEAFEARVAGFYLKPAQKLVREDDAFARGLICVALIDFIARYSSGSRKVRERFTSWLEDSIVEFKGKDPLKAQTLGSRFYEDFRNGLVHEGRIKNLGQFSCDFDTLLHLIDGGMVVNPTLLIQKTDEGISRYCELVRNDESEFKRLKRQLEIDFREEMKGR